MKWQTVRCAAVAASVLGLCAGWEMSMAAADTGYGNNLSVPVVFSEGHGLTGYPVEVATGLRGSMLVDNFSSLTAYSPLHYTASDAGAGLDVDGVPLWSNWFYEQKTEATWQAQWESAVAGIPVEVSYVDWGDSLLSQTWSTLSKIRVEVTLLLDNTGKRMKGYAMNHLSGSGIDEVWAAADDSPLGAASATRIPRYIPKDASESPITYATVYSSCARLTVYKFNADKTAMTKVFSFPVYAKYGQDGPGGFSAEVNVGGKCIYGYNWNPRDNQLTAGWYRVEFSLDPLAGWTIAGESGSYTGGVIRNLKINSLNPLDTAFKYVPGLATDGFSTYVDVELTAKGKGRSR